LHPARGQGARQRRAGPYHPDCRSGSVRAGDPGNHLG